MIFQGQKQNLKLWKMLHFHIITFFIPVMSQVYSLFVVLVYLKKKKKMLFVVKHQKEDKNNNYFLSFLKGPQGKVFGVACVTGRRMLERFQKYFCDTRISWSKYFTYGHTGSVVYTSCGTLLEPSHWMWLWWLTLNFTQLLDVVIYSHGMILW